MFDQFVLRAQRAKDSFERLQQSQLIKVRTSPLDRARAGIYVLYEGEIPVYVGRTRNLRQRLKAHLTPNHNSASFALKRVREKNDLKTTYQKKGSRQYIANTEPYRSAFLNEIECIRAMSFRFVEETDPIDQYFLELYATMAFELPLDGFGTH